MQHPDEQVVPQIIKDALYSELERNKESRKDFQYSATVLIKSPRQVQLEKRHASELDLPTIFNIWYSFAGSAFHDYLEKNLRGNDRYLVERRLIRQDLDRTVGAKFDAYDTVTKTLYDHKTTSTYIFGKEMKEEWIQQLMINAFFLENEGHKVDKVAINAIYVDWRETRLRYSKEGEYPLAPCTVFEVDAWPIKDREYLYFDLLQKHIDEEQTPDELLPYCSTLYTWETPGKVAVYREGNARAIRLVNTFTEAQDYIKWKGLTGNIRIESRPAARRRCQDYCSVSRFCNQYQDWTNKQALNNPPEETSTMTEEPLEKT